MGLTVDADPGLRALGLVTFYLCKWFCVGAKDSAVSRVPFDEPLSQSERPTAPSPHTQYTAPGELQTVWDTTI